MTQGHVVNGICLSACLPACMLHAACWPFESSTIRKPSKTLVAYMNICREFRLNSSQSCPNTSAARTESVATGRREGEREKGVASGARVTRLEADSAPCQEFVGPASVGLVGVLSFNACGSGIASEETSGASLSSKLVGSSSTGPSIVVGLKLASAPSSMGIGS